MRVLVIGAGIAGLGAATYFAKRGHTVEVLEKSDRIGGRAITVTSRRGDQADAGTQYFHTNYRRALSLMQECGLLRHLSKVSGYTRFFDDRVAKGFFDVSHRWPWFPPAGFANIKAAGILAKLLLEPPDVFSLEFRRRLDNANALDELQDRRLREFTLRPLMLAGSLAEPETANPSLLQVLRLLRIVVLTDYLVLPGGIASFHEALAAQLPLRLGKPATRLVVEKAVVRGVEAADGEVMLADHVVVATTPREASKLIPNDWKEERKFLEGVTVPEFILPTFFLDRSVSPDIWSYVVQHQRGKYLSFVVDAARKSAAMVGSANSVLQAWICHPAAAEIAGWSDDDIVDLCRGELEELFPGFSSWIEEVQVTRHPYAVPFHRTGHQQQAIDFLRRTDERKGVSFCGDYFSGGFVEAALWSAERAAKRHG